jgi:poly(hydroxyalkanoate) depolymerase family esterase
MNWFRNATQAIKRALTGTSVTSAADPHTPPSVDAGNAAIRPAPAEMPPSIVGNRPLESALSPPAAAAPPIDQALDMEAAPSVTATVVTDLAETPPIDLPDQAKPAPTPLVRDEIRTAVEPGPGEFTSGAHTSLLQTRRYKLYVPPSHADRLLPLVVMLHGCNQDPDDFATGTGMNAQAREQGFYVLYPEQSPFANASRCWNWFKHEHQQRDSGEPALLAGMTRAVMERHGIDPSRVFIAGMSAGGAMAAIVAAAYPELFSGVGVHSGLPRGAASNVFEALAVMKSGADVNTDGSAVADDSGIVPTIVFHGDLDKTVHPRNGEQVIAELVSRVAVTGLREMPESPLEGPQIEQGESVHGRRYTRYTHRDRGGNTLAEYWQLHGGGHAWSGGNPEGSYTDANGPDSTREMLRFFFARQARSENPEVHMGRKTGALQTCV